MTRVARLNENMWTELFVCNREPLLSELNTLIGNLCRYRDALAEEREDDMRALLRVGRERKEAADRKDDEP